KIGFANEMGAICQAYGVDSHAVMEVFASDTKLNISRAYLRPGFAFGGSCLPKDVRAIVYHARRADLSVPILENVNGSNEAHLRRVYDRLLEGTARRVALLGLAFKQGTDDLRESPMVELAERLLGRGFDLSIHDAHVRISHLTGSNRAYVDARIPHLSRLMVASPMAAVFGAEIVVLASTEADSIEAAAGAQDALLVDLVRRPELAGHAGGYLGAAWGEKRRGAHPDTRRQPKGAFRPARVAGVPGARRGGPRGHRHLPARGETRHRALRIDRGRGD